MKTSLNQLAIDHMYYINLAGSTEKNEHCIAEFAKHELDVERVEAVNDSEYETTGRMLSTYKAQNHSVINTLLDAIANGYQRIAMFEDDVIFTDDAPEVLADALQYFPEKWDFLALGCLANGAPSNHIGGRLYSLAYCALAHANVYSESMFQPLIDELEKMELPVDMCVAKLIRDFDNYISLGILYKGIAYQKAGFRSDNLKVDNYDNSEVT
jgi:GR25 family glycosyltransferase involved in LPS biosynthesis